MISHWGGTFWQKPQRLREVRVQMTQTPAPTRVAWPSRRRCRSSTRHRCLLYRLRALPCVGGHAGVCLFISVWDRTDWIPVLACLTFLMQLWLLLDTYSQVHSAGWWRSETQVRSPIYHSWHCEQGETSHVPLHTITDIVNRVRQVLLPHLPLLTLWSGWDTCHVTLPAIIDTVNSVKHMSCCSTIIDNVNRVIHKSFCPIYLYWHCEQRETHVLLPYVPLLTLWTGWDTSHITLPTIFEQGETQVLLRYHHSLKTNEPLGNDVVNHLWVCCSEPPLCACCSEPLVRAL